LYIHYRERLQAESDMSLHETKSQLLAQFQQDKLDHDKIVEELKTQLQFTEEKSKLEVETCRMDCIAELDNVRKEHEVGLYKAIAEKEEKHNLKLNNLRKSHEDILDKVTQNLETLFEERLEELRINFHTSKMRTRRGAAAKMLVMLFEQGDRYRRSYALQTWRRHAKVMALEQDERQSWKYCQNTAAIERLKTFFYLKSQKMLIRAVSKWKKNTFDFSRKQQQRHFIAVGVSLQKICGYWRTAQKLNLILAFYRLKNYAVVEHSRLKMRFASERARDRQETQGLRFKQLYTDNTSLRNQVKTLGREVQDLTTKAELWRRRCISK
jgi:hypothetical protein